MYGNILNLTRCCFCLPLRYGLLVWSYIKLVVTIVLLGILLAGVPMLVWILLLGTLGLIIISLYVLNVVMLLFDIIFNITFIVGLHKKNTTLIRMYWRYGIAFAVALIIYFLLIAGFLISENSTTIFGNLSDPIIKFASGVTAVLIIHAYFMLLIRSELHKLKTNNHFEFENHVTEPVCVMKVPQRNK